MNNNEFIQTLVTDYLAKFGLALIILLVGWVVIKLTARIVRRSLEHRFDPALSSFIVSVLRTALLVLLVITAASTVGIEMTSFIALLGAAGFATGLALQGSLSNFAGGVLILLIHPFQAGDLIEVDGVRGTVLEVQLLYTILSTPDNKRVYLPNGELSNHTITNFFAHETRRIDLQFGIGYDDDFEEAKQIINNIVTNHEDILSEPEPLIRLGEHADSSLEIYTRVWVNSQDYWNVYYDLHEEVKNRFDEAGIGIPYPQLDVHFDQPNDR